LLHGAFPCKISASLLRPASCILVACGAHAFAPAGFGRPAAFRNLLARAAGLAGCRLAPASGSAARRVPQLPEMSSWENMWSRDGGLKPGTFFDASGSSPALLEVLEKDYAGGKGKGKTALVPGCGRGYDVVNMARLGFAATGSEISKTAAAAAEQFAKEARTQDGPAWEGSTHITLVDFFELQPPGGGYDLIYDYTFLCALDPGQREKWAATMRRLMKPGQGELITLIFPLGDFAGGPPHAMSQTLVEGLLTREGFEAMYLAPVPPEKSHPGRGGKEILARWRLCA